MDGNEAAAEQAVSKRKRGGARAERATEETQRVDGDGREYASRAGAKLEAALRAFDISAAGKTCIDFGSHTGGFVECLLNHNAARVYAVDPGKGVLASHLRADPRVVTCEGANALQWRSPEPAELITIDVGWTVQRLILPVARRCLAPGGAVVSLIKPHYEAEKSQLRRGVVREEALDLVLELVREDIRDLRWVMRGEIESPLTGHGGNRESVVHLVR